MPNFEIRRATAVAEVFAAGEQFDNPVRAEWAQKFLATPGHHLLLAYVDDAVAGFVSGVEMVHPDKGTEMFLYELGVGEQHRRQGIGRALTLALADIAKASGCYGMWVPVDHDNEIAQATYRSTGTVSQSDAVIMSWEFPS